MLMLMLLGVVFDASEKTDDFINSGASFKTIALDYYVNFIIHYTNLLASFFVFIAVIFFTSRLAQNSEFIAMLSSGMSFNRILRPYMVVATLLTVGSIYVNQTVLPKANKKRIDFEMRYIKTYHPTTHHFYSEVGKSIQYCERYIPDRKLLINCYIENWEDKKLQSTFIADEGVYDSLTGTWHFTNYYIRYVGEPNDSLVKGQNLDTTLQLAPKDFNRNTDIIEAMTNTELDEFIASEKAKGSEKIQTYLVHKHTRTAFPFSTYILTIIGVSIAGRKSRGGTGFHIILGIFLAVMYIFLNKVTTVAALNVGFDAFLAVWIPNFIFMILAYITYLKAQK